MFDAVMERTKERPIPSKRIYPAEKARNPATIEWFS